MAAKIAKGGWNLRAGKIWLASRGHQAEIGDRIAVKGGAQAVCAPAWPPLLCWRACCAGKHVVACTR